jgi:recombination protein RecA
MTKTDELLKHLRKELKLEDDSLALTSGDNVDLQIERIPLGIPSLDAILGGGLPRGRMINVVGLESVGKTLLAQKAIAAVQREGGNTALVDVEKTFDPEWATVTGINVKDLIISQPDSGEQALDIVVALIKAGIDLVILDSVATLCPMAEEEADMENAGVGLQPRLYNRGLRKITAVNKKSVFIAINQWRMKIGGYGDPRTMPGGRAQYHLASMNLVISRRGWKEENVKVGGKSVKKKVGFNIEVYTEKNKTFTPYLTAEIPFLFTGVIDTIAGLITLALDCKIITQNGPYYTYHSDGKEEVKILGREGVIKYLNDNPSEVEFIKSKIEMESDVDETDSNESPVESS